MRKIRRNRLKHIATITFCAGVLVYMSIMARLNIKYFEQTIVGQTQRHLLNIARSESQNFAVSLGDLLEKLNSLASNPSIKDAIINYDQAKALAGTKGDSPDEILFEQFSSEIDNVYRLDAKGIIQNRAPFKRDRIGVDFSHKPGVKYVIENHVPYISDIFRANSGRSCFSVCSPVFDEKDFIGVMRSIVYLDNISRIVPPIDMGENSHVWVIDKNATVIVHPEKRYIGNNIVAAYKEEVDDIDWSALENIVAKMTNGQTGTGSYLSHFDKEDDLESSDKLVAFVPVQVGSHSWSIGVTMEYDEISGPIEDHSRILLLDTVCLVCILTAIGIAYYRAEKRRVQLETQYAIGRVNKELESISIERQETATTLQERSDLLNSIISVIPYHVFWKDSDSVYQGCNGTFAEFVGLNDPGDIVGKTDHDLPWSKEQADFFKKCDSEIIKTNIPLLDIKESLTGASGKDISVETSKFILRNSRGQITGILGIYKQIQDSEAAGDEPGQAKQIESGDVKKLLADMNYRLRTPMNCIMGFADLLKQEDLSEEQSKFVEMIYANSKELLENINGITGSQETVRDESSNKQEAPPVGREQKPESKEQKAPQTDTSNDSKTEKPHILIVDDVNENTQLMEVLLKKAGYKTTSCCNGKQAVELAEKQRFDVILMDIRMPIMDGIAATKAIKSGGLNLATPIIAMTAVNTAADRELCLDAGCDDYIAKPVNKKTLLRKAWRFIEQTKQMKVAQHGDDIVSVLNDDPDYRKTIDMFVTNLPEQISAMQKALDDNNLHELSLKIHALKGLGGFAGFPIYTERAKELEQVIEDNQMERVRQQLGQLAELCRKTKANHS